MLQDGTYLRNVNTIVEVAAANGIVPVLVTQAHSTDPEIPFARDAEGIGHFAALLRSAAEAYGERVLFVDFDRLLTGARNDLFHDVGHHTAEGVQFTGEMLAAAIHGHWSSRRSTTPGDSAPDTKANRVILGSPAPAPRA